MIVYALVARGRTVLSEFTSQRGNFSTVTRALLSKIPAADGRMSYVCDDHVFHYQVADGITYLCMADQEGKRRIAFAFLEDVKRRFESNYGSSKHDAAPFALNADFAPTLERQLTFYNSDPSSDDLQRVQTQLEAVKGVMVENVEKVLERGEKFELLVDKTDRLARQAFRFESSSRELKSAMFWRKVKMYSIYFGVAAVLGLILVSWACGGVTAPSCRSKPDAKRRLV